VAIVVDPQPVAVDELAALFTGIPDETGGWESSPCYRFTLAFEVARRTTPATLYALRRTFYGSADDHEIPDRALNVIEWAFNHWQKTRRDQGVRGL
jgi:hypothetical protein